MSERRLRVRLSIGALLILAVLVLTAHDAVSSLEIGAIVLGALASVALVEYARMMPARGGSRAVGAAVAAGCVVLFWRPVGDLLGAHPPAGFFCILFGLACAAPALALLLSRRTVPVGPEDARDLGVALLGLLITVFPALCLGEIGHSGVHGPHVAPKVPFFSPHSGANTEDEMGPWLLLATILTCKLNDIGGYLVGSMVGRTRLATGISPKKSVEGAVAGLVLGIAGSVAGFFAWLGVLGLVQSMVFGLVVSMASQLGDLCESLIKRSAGVKDSGALIPAFGGILDLLDSFILAGPAGYTLLRLWAF